MDPFVIVIFGASGDLTQRKLIPAIFQLYKTGYLPDNFAVLGISRTEFSDEDFRQSLFFDNKYVKKENADETSLTDFSSRLYYESIQTNEAADYGKVKARLQELDEQRQTGGNYLFYLSVPPFLYEKIPGYLAEHGLNEDADSWRRLIIEKPFGHDEDSARALNNRLCQFFEETQIFRIDHYLGKETVQNLLVTRFANGIFEPIWNRHYIDHIQITSAEDIGVEKRGGYYDDSGALRDMVQNHLLQVMAHIAMEPPTNADAKSIRNEKVKFFDSIRPIREKEVNKYVVRGQYMQSTVEGKSVPAYRQEEGIPEDSKTETYVALKAFVDNWRWADVPFYIRTGKRLPTKVTEVAVMFKSPPHHLFREEKGVRNEVNKLIIRIQPDEGLALQFGMKVPGAGFKVKDVYMDFHYSDLTNAYVPEAYERLIMDCLKGDATLYARGDAVEAAWRFVDPIVHAWKKDGHIKLHGYPAGSWGPSAAAALFEHPGVSWHNPCAELTPEEEFREL